MRICLIVLMLFAAVAGVAAETQPGSRDGEVRTLGDGEYLAWDAVSQEWLGPEEFWANFAGRGRGRIWPSGAEYPTHSEVREHDTILIQTADGPCLMYFFHTRWRRANDVRRWGDDFNAYGGCPTVFD